MAQSSFPRISGGKLKRPYKVFGFSFLILERLEGQGKSSLIETKKAGRRIALSAQAHSR